MPWFLFEMMHLFSTDLFYLSFCHRLSDITGGQWFKIWALPSPHSQHITYLVVQQRHKIDGPANRMRAVGDGCLMIHDST